VNIEVGIFLRCSFQHSNQCAAGPGAHLGGSRIRDNLEWPQGPAAEQETSTLQHGWARTEGPRQQGGWEAQGGQSGLLRSVGALRASPTR